MSKHKAKDAADRLHDMIEEMRCCSHGTYEDQRYAESAEQDFNEAIQEFRAALDMTARSSFGSSLRDARVVAGLSLREAAALLGTTPVRLGEVERGVRTHAALNARAAPPRDASVSVEGE